MGEKTEREIVTVGWDGASQPKRRYRDELDLPDHLRTRVVLPKRKDSGAQEPDAQG